MVSVTTETSRVAEQQQLVGPRARAFGFETGDARRLVGASEVPLTAELAPNFELAVAVMTDARQAADAKPDAEGKLPFVRRFHEAASPFATRRTAPPARSRCHGWPPRTSG